MLSHWSLLLSEITCISKSCQRSTPQTYRKNSYKLSDYCGILFRFSCIHHCNCIARSLTGPTLSTEGHKRYRAHRSIARIHPLVVDSRIAYLCLSFLQSFISLESSMWCHKHQSLEKLDIFSGKSHPKEENHSLFVSSVHMIHVKTFCCCTTVIHWNIAGFHSGFKDKLKILLR